MPVHESLTTAERVATGSYNTSIHTHTHTHDKKRCHVPNTHIWMFYVLFFSLV